MERRTMEAAMKRIGCIGLLLVASTLCGQAWAGPFEDATAAYQRGDYPTALRLFRPFAAQGDASAQTALGFMYSNGQGMLQDYAEAVKWYRLAADQGQAGAQYNLGLMYASGQGMVRDYAEAVKWYRLAADQGDASAQNGLGLMYANGQGVPQDYAEAGKRVRKAADQGDAEAQFNLGVMYHEGYGVPQDYVQAHQWLNLAASGFPSSKKGERDRAVRNRDILAAMMTPVQVAEAQRLAREWNPK
jgi:TPR repeat protein